MQRKGVQWLIAIATVILAAVLVVLLVRNHLETQRRDAALLTMLDQARPIERELDRAKRELAERERALNDNEKSACLMVGYQIVQRSDIDFANHQAKHYGFTPVFVLDPTLENVRELLDALRETPCEIVFSASPCTPETSNAAELRELLAEPERAAVDTGCFLLRSTDDSAETLALVASSGYTGCIRHADTGENTVLETGVITLSYSQIKSGAFSVKNRLDKALAAGQALLFVFDMESMRAGTLTGTDAENALTEISAAWTEQGLTPGTVVGALEEVRVYSETKAMTRAEFEAYDDEQREKIAALEAELDAVYAQWNKGENE